MKHATKHLPLALLLLLPLFAAAAEVKLPELKMRYSASWSGIGLGEIEVTLSRSTTPDCYQYRSQSNPVGLVRMFYGTPREVSEFCVKDGKVVPKRFSFISTKDEEDDFSLIFDMANGKVTNHKGRVREIPPNAQDRFGIQQAVRLWLLSQVNAKEPGTVEFAMVDKGKIRHYRFAITAFEEVEVPAGKFETVLVQRIDNPKRISKFWIAPSMNYMPVKVEQLKDGGGDLRMQLLDG